VWKEGRLGVPLASYELNGRQQNLRPAAADPGPDSADAPGCGWRDGLFVTGAGDSPGWAFITRPPSDGFRPAWCSLAKTGGPVFLLELLTNLPPQVPPKTTGGGLWGVDNIAIS